MDKEFDKFAKELEQITKDIPMKQAVTAKRTGIINRIIDRIVIGRFFWAEAFAFLAIIQTIVIFTALIPQSVVTINEFFVWMHIPIVLPIGFSSTFTVLFIICIFVIGFIIVRYMKTATVGAEYGAKTNPSMFLLWKKLESLEKKLEELNESNNNRK